MTITAHRNQLKLNIEEKSKSEKKSMLSCRLDNETRTKFNSKLSLLGISQQFFFEKCIEFFLDNKLNLYFGLKTEEEVMKKRFEKDSKDFHRIDIKLPLELYHEIVELAEKIGEPINHLSGKPVIQQVCIELLELGIETLKEQRPDLYE